MPFVCSDHILSPPPLTDTFLAPCRICIESELEGGSRWPVEVERTLSSAVFLSLFCFSPSLLLSLYLQQLHTAIFWYCFAALFHSIRSLRRLFIIITSLFLFLALDISSNIGSPALCCTALFFSPALFLSCRSFKFFSLFISCVGRGGKLVEGGPRGRFVIIRSPFGLFIA